MPKKTKHKKILAYYRNKLKQEQLQSLPITSINRTQESSQESSTIVIKKEGNEDTDIVTTYFRQDFTKSILLIIGIITLELIFYFVSMSNNLRTVFKFIP